MLRLGRRLAIVALALSQLALVGAGAFIDSAPSAPGHRHHIAAESSVGCHPYHDEHCVVCRVLTGGAVGAAAIGLPSAAAPVLDAAAAGHPDAYAARDPASLLRPRAPPLA